MIKYEEAPDLQLWIERIVEKLGMGHVDVDRVKAVRSFGSKARRTIARCHALPRIIQTALLCRPLYVIEVISGEFDKLSEEDKVKTLIHELLHIPKSFGGGFQHHAYFNEAMIEKLYREFVGC